MSQWVHIPRYCGIYYLPDFKPESARTATPNWLPLVNVTANARISNYCANVTLTQTFVPPSSNAPNAKIPEAKYSFPVFPSSSVVSFVARMKVNGAVVKTIRGVVKSLLTAKKEYQEAVTRGETAGFLEQVEEDVFTMKLGNIPQAKGTEVEVDVGYVTELKHDSEVDGIRFTIPTAIAARYGNNSTGVASTSGSHVRDGLEMNVEIDMPGPVTSVQSPSHPIAVTVGSLRATGNQDAEFNPKLAFAKLSQARAHLESDFILQVLCKDSAAPKALLETIAGANGTVDSAALMLTFVPKFVIPPAAGKKVRKEIIFMVDRSGSMYDKIEPLKSALKVFLKSLPPNDGTRFDICSFGSRYSFLFDEKKTGEKPGSRLYSQKSLKTALDHVEEISANYGGTEIFAPIKEACDRVLKRNKERNERIAAGKENEEDNAEWETEVLLLTDGEVWDTKPLFDLVREHTQEWRAAGKRADGRAGIRVFTLGIGKDVSHGFVEGLAEAGGGYCMTVGDNERFEGKVVRMLKAALGQRVGGYKLTFDGMEEWGVTSNEASCAAAPESDDDFEMVDDPTGPSEKDATATSAPISLFDTSANPDSMHENTKPAATTLVPPALIHTPHIIPPLFPFNRTNVYLLLSPRTSSSSLPLPSSSSLPLPKSVQLKAVTSSGQPLELTIPVSQTSFPGCKTLHQLATKKYLDNLKAGESWIHSACGSGKKLECIVGEGETAKKSSIKLHSPDSDDFNEDEFEEIVKREGERIGVQWGVVGKWTAFVALEETDAGHKPMEGPETLAVASAPLSNNLPQVLRTSPLTMRSRWMHQSAAPSYSATSPSYNPSPLVAFASARGGSSHFASNAPPPRLDLARGGGNSLGFGAPPPPPPPPGFAAAPKAAVAIVPGAARASSESSPISTKSFHRKARRKADSDEEAEQASVDTGALHQFLKKTVKAKKISTKAQHQEEEQRASPSPTSDADAAGRLIDLQQFEGFWNINGDFLASLWSRSNKVDSNRLTIASLKEVAAKELGLPESTNVDLKEKILGTCLALVWFQYRLASEQDTWELVVDKAKDWLDANAGGNLDSALAKAKEILGIA